MAGQRGGFFSGLPIVTKNLIIINILIWLVEAIFPRFGINGIIHHLGLHYFGATHFNPVQLLTYMFVHDQASIMHVFFNMLTLFFFGPWLEKVWGSKRFLFFYFVCGVGAALIQEGVWALTWKNDFIEGLASVNGMTFDQMRQIVEEGIGNHGSNVYQFMVDFQNNAMVTVGASGAIFGILLGFAFLFPNQPMYLFFVPIPIKAKYMVIGYGIIEFFAGVTHTMNNVAHFAHLGGMIFGLILLFYWKKNGTLYGSHGNSF